MWLETVQEPENNSEKCPTCGSHVRRRVYGEMHAGSFVSDGKRVEIRRTPCEGFHDPVVLDPLTQYFDGGLYRLWPSETYFSRGGKKLHREVWRVAFGEIPKGCHIHRRDGDAANNSVENLECMEGSEHLSYTLRKSPRQPTDAVRAAAAAWHRSEAGRLWHRRHAERAKSWTKWKREDKPCEHCGNVFNALIRKSGHSQRFCSANCKAAAYRKRRGAE